MQNRSSRTPIISKPNRFSVVNSSQMIAAGCEKDNLEKLQKRVGLVQR
jgi:hypothetical protein